MVDNHAQLLFFEDAGGDEDGGEGEYESEDENEGVTWFGGIYDCLHF